MIEPDSSKIEEEEEKKSDPSGYLILLGVLALVAIWISYGLWADNWNNKRPPDCTYTNRGCQGDNRWGQ